MTKQDYDGFTVNMFFDEDDQWLAHFLELQSVSAFGDTPAKALTELKTAWESLKECYVEDGEAIPVAPENKNYSGKFNARIDKRVHKSLALKAAQAGISLNALVSQKLAKDT